MLHILEIQNCFRHKHLIIPFHEGFTAITGPNEAGKSLIFEMITYALFGAAALRGKAEDYKKLRVALDFSIMGERYKVERTMKTCELTREGASLASGTKVVNLKITELLGYDIKVFELANYAKQNNLTALSDMKPTERKTMVDNVIGLNVLDDIADAIARKQSEAKGVMEGIGTLSEVPEAPMQPEGYLDSQSVQCLRSEQAQTAQLVVEQATLAGWLANPRQKPIEPAYPEGLEDPEVVDSQYALLIEKRNKLQQLQGKATAYVKPIISLAEAQAGVAQCEAWRDHQAAVSTLANCVSVPPYAVKDLEEMKTAWVAFNSYTAQMKIYESIPENHCPACDHVWHSESVVQPEWVAEPGLPYAEVIKQLNQHEQWVAQKAVRELAQQVPPATAPAQPLSYYQQQVGANTTWAEGEQVLAEIQVLLAEVAALAHYEQQAKLLDQYDTLYDAFEAQGEAWRLWAIESAIKQQRWDELNLMGLAEKQAQQAAQLQTFLQYEKDLSNYQVAKNFFDEKVALLRETQAKLDDYAKVRIALKDLRVKVKKYLVPSLNKVASHLLVQMTNGARQTITIDEDFDILVDGQPVATLSGSGKAIANLAIRIGLGQVLINKKFSVFMADEIDGDMDEVRAAATAGCLERLTKNIGQLLLISHKKPEAQHYVELK
jgi:exonuclease SbcC